LSATVSAIPITATVVVIVVAVAITTPTEHLTFSRAFLGHRRRIAALTLLAVSILVLIRAFGVSTAVSTVPVATTDIIYVVAFSIALPLMHAAVFRALSIRVDKRLVQTRATEAVAIVILEAATVSSVPVASAVVILVIALFISNPSEHLAWLATLGFRWIQARAVSTVLKRCRFQLLVCFSTTVATVPVATTLIVAVVTVAITFPRFHCALRYALVVTFEIGVTTTAIGTVLVIVLLATAVSTIPSAAAVVILVVTVAIATERVHRTRSIAIDSRVLA